MIYFIQAGPGGNIKIGYSADVSKRLLSLQTGSSVRLVVLLTMPGDIGKETELHARFSFLRVTGEWFSPYDELLSYIEEIRAEQSRPAGLKIYLAGKIKKNCWRHSIVKGLRGSRMANCPQEPLAPLYATDWPILKRSIFGTHHYVGPFFFSCDHSCWHGDDSHGVRADFSLGTSLDYAMNQAERVVILCQEKIQECDLFFAWIDSLDCYGTISEIGYAAALGKEIWISGPRRFRDMWFVYQHCRSANTPLEFSMWTFKSPSDALERVLGFKANPRQVIVKATL